MRLREDARRRSVVPLEPEAHAPLDVVWSPLARTRLREIRMYVAADKPAAAERLAMRIVAVVEALRDHPHLGRPGGEPGVRELVIGGTPYIVVYRMDDTRLTISTICHGAQQPRR